MTAKATMISFACSGCGRGFTVPASYVGRKATCKTCATKVVVPALSEAPQLAERIAAGVGQDAPYNDQRHSTVEASDLMEAQALGDIHGARTHAIADEMSRTTTTRRRPSHFEVVSEAQSPPLAAALAPSDEAEVETPLPVAEHSPQHSEMGEMVDPSAEVSQETSEIEEIPAPTPPAKIPVRIRRLMVDAEQMAKAFSGDGPIRIKSAVGDPPELYKVEYHVKGLQKGWFGRPKKRDTHVVEIQLTSEFPRVSPKCRMLTPVFHPNIDDTTVCITDHWTAGERLVDLVVRIGEMLAYQAYNIKSPLNGEAAMWADLNPKQLPVDSRNLHPGEIT